MVAVEGTARATAAALQCREQEVYLASTGVIGEPLDYEKIERALPALRDALAADAWAGAAAAIMTTDTFPKLATRSVVLGGKTVTIHGIAKGSGMIAPDMATMLSFVFTDANLPASVLQELLSTSVKGSFKAGAKILYVIGREVLR